jgi:hypothetical protein
MMSRIKLGLASVLAIFTALIVCGIAASGASAEFKLTEAKCEGGANAALCYEKEKTGKLFEFEGTEEFEILPLLGEQHILFETKIGTEPIHIVCKAVDAEHTKEIKEEKEILAPDGLIVQPKPLGANTTLEFHLNFLECKLEGAINKKCEIPPSEPTSPLVGTPDELETKKPDDDEITFKPAKVGAPFIEINFKNVGAEKCPATIIGKHRVNGEVLCFVDKEEKLALEDLEEHELICDPERGGQVGKLFFAAGGENPATLLSELEIALLTTDLWNISNEA